MSAHRTRNLSTLVQLRSTEVERLQQDMTHKESTRQRYANSIEQLAALCAGSGTSGTLAPALAANCGAYKEALIRLADTHRTDLALHEADMAHTRQALNAAHARREALALMLTRQQKLQDTEQQRRERKQHDELATQSWMRERT